VGPAARPAPRRATLFTAIALALPFAALALMEVGLRMAGFGRDLEAVFIASPENPGWRQANPRAVLRLFADERDAPVVSIETGYFRAAKPAGSLRIFVQGESTAAGFPYGLGASLAGLIDSRLEQALPEREVEVISTAMAAVNSYALDDFADAVLAEQPDAVLIYVGHNEYLGILGVGSTLRVAGSPWLTRAFLAVREWRLFQLVQRVLAGGADAPRTREAAALAERTLMAHVAGERQIAFDSPLFRRGLAQFAHNLDRLLARYARAGVPAFIGTLASNERDRPPFAGEAARAHFARARDLESAGNLRGARAAYLAAKDHDELRFRAPEAFNEVIRRVAARHGARVVDVQEQLVRASPHGAIGSNLMLEHVHPNLDGYFLLADAYLDALAASGLLGDGARQVAEAEAREWLPLTEIDLRLADYKLARILAAWPFTTTASEPELPAPSSKGARLAQALYRGELDWANAQELLRRAARSRGDEREYARISRVLADAFPFAGRLQFETAAALIGLGRPLEALRYGRRAVESGPHTVDFLLVDAHASALTGRVEAARQRLERVLEIEPANATARAALAALSARTESGRPRQERSPR
jgi:lysophospholipase L1-like esterase